MGNYLFSCCHLLFILFFDSYNVRFFFAQQKEINDIKLLLRVLKMYIPLPVFWALFHQQVIFFICQTIKCCMNVTETWIVTQHRSQQRYHDSSMNDNERKQKLALTFRKVLRPVYSNLRGGLVASLELALLKTEFLQYFPKQSFSRDQIAQKSVSRRRGFKNYESQLVQKMSGPNYLFLGELQKKKYQKVEEYNCPDNCRPRCFAGFLLTLSVFKAKQQY